MSNAEIGDADFAALIGRDRTMVSKLRRGILRPTLDVAAAIEAATEGAVPMQAWVVATDAVAAA
jgi:DNA-binding transcriptional regulator YdaS (Cro superfamily)